MMFPTAFPSARYVLEGRVVDVRVRPTYRRFDWSALYGTPPVDAVDGVVEWRLLDVSTHEVIKTFSTSVREMVAASTEDDYVNSVAAGALRQAEIDWAPYRLAG